MKKALIEYLYEQRNVGDKGIYFIVTKDKTEFLSYSDLYKTSKVMAQYLKKVPYQYMMLQIESLEDFICALWACLFANKTLFPLKYAESEGDLELIKHILKVSNQTGIIQDRGSIAKALNIEQEKIIWIDELKRCKEEIEFDVCEESGAEHIVMIQFSSGSTGNPKGIVTKNKNLIANIEAMISRYNFGKRDKSMTKKVLDWIPLTHNLGLIVGHFMTLMRGIDEYIMPTKMFIKNPMLFLEKMDEYKITATHSPNFAMDLLVKLSMNYKKRKLDLSNLSVFSVGSEYVSVKTCQSFLKCMERFHMPETAVQPGYGLTEATVVVSNTIDRPLKYRNLNRDKLSIGDQIEEVAEDDVRCASFVEEGSVMDCVRVKIVDNEGNALRDGHVGKVLLKGDSIVDGYYLGDNNFQPLEVDSDNWFETGDLGFMINGYFTIIGRNKEVIIINGKNYYPTDFENLIVTTYPQLKRSVIIIGKENIKTGENEIYCFIKAEKIDQELAELVEAINALIINKIQYKLKEVIPVLSFPLTGSGKVRRFRLLELLTQNEFQENLNKLHKVQKQKKNRNFDDSSLGGELQKIAEKLIKEVQQLAAKDSITIFDNLFDVGFNSVLLTQFLNFINETFDTSFRIQELINCKTVLDISSLILERRHYVINVDKSIQRMQLVNKESYDDDIAIIGVDLTTADAKNVDEFWNNLCNGKISVNEFPKKRVEDAVAALKKIGVEADANDFGRGAYLEAVDAFDCKFFKMVPKVASMINPQQRMLLETSWKAFEDAGYTLSELKGTKTGVFIAHSALPFVNTYYDYSRFIMECEEDIGAIAMPGNLNSIMARRISQYYDFHGPCMLIDTACSSSLTAMHTACSFIQNGDCDMALVGTVKMDLFPIREHKIGIESEDGYTRTFDNGANGTGRGEGIAAIILKPYRKAVEDKDNIYAVVKGSAINNDGNSIGLTVPNMEAQRNVLMSAWKNAGIQPDNLAFLEAHGTATKIGDPIEISALTEAAAAFVDKKQFCPIGSVKTNIGHLDHAAGLFGVIKSMLALYYKQLPPNMNYQKANESIDFENSPVYVNTKLLPLDNNKELYCGVSSFGFSGTNCHIVMKAEQRRKKNGNEGKKIYKITANSMTALKNMLNAQICYLVKTEDSFQDICYTAGACRNDFKFRYAIIAKDKVDLIEKLKFIKENTGLSDVNKGIYFSEQPIELKSTDSSLQKVCKRYTAKEEVDWKEFYKGLEVQKVHIPGYIFDKKRCWLSL